MKTFLTISGDKLLHTAINGLIAIIKQIFFKYLLPLRGFFQIIANSSTNSMYKYLQIINRILCLRYIMAFTEEKTSPMYNSAQGLEGGDSALFPNEISAPYEVPQFPIEQIEKKLQIQRQINFK